MRGSRSATRSAAQNFLQNGTEIVRTPQANFSNSNCLLGLFCTPKFVRTTKSTDKSAAGENCLEFGPNFRSRGSADPNDPPWIRPWTHACCAWATIKQCPTGWLYSVTWPVSRGWTDRWATSHSYHSVFVTSLVFTSQVLPSFLPS